MELIEKDSSNNLLSAKVRAICRANLYPMLSAYFTEQTGQSLQTGMQVLLQGSISFHPVYGLSFQVSNIDPSYTLGDMERQRRETIERLKEDGVVDMQKHIVLPTLIQRIAVISSSEAAGYEDFCNQLHNNTFQFCYKTELFPALVQGDRAEKSIIEALLQIYERKDEFQMVVIIRGGGSSVDLKCFDSYTLAFYCAQFPLPIIAGIGHQRDVSVVDLVAHTSVKTPTAAAEFIIAHTAVQQEKLQMLRQRLSMVCVRPIANEKQKLATLQIRLRQSLIQMLYVKRNRLQMIEHSIGIHSPMHIYKMGYSLTTHNGKLIHTIEELKEGDELITEFQNGKVASIVKR